MSEEIILGTGGRIVVCFNASRKNQIALIH